MQGQPASILLKKDTPVAAFELSLAAATGEGLQLLQTNGTLRRWKSSVSFEPMRDPITGSGFCQDRGAID